MDTETVLMAAIHADPADELAWLALADWWEECGDGVRAEHFRLLRWLTADHLHDSERPSREHRLREIMAGGFVPRLPALELELARSTKLKAVLIPAGTFWMGSDERPSARGAEHPRHRVTLTRPYYIGATPVTQKQWHAVMGTRPSHFKGLARPVDQVSWSDCGEFCERVAERTGRRVRLPWEAEWEKACRAGTSAAYYSGDAESDLGRAAWFSAAATRNVGLGEPNGHGLHDMLGNIWEWTLDAYQDYPTSGRARRDPRKRRGSPYRSARGGSYGNPANCCGCAGRISFAAGGRNTFIGCRVVVEWEPALRRG